MDSGAMTISGWKETSEAGNPYTSSEVLETFHLIALILISNSERNTVYNNDGDQ